jgi:ferredoxin
MQFAILAIIYKNALLIFLVDWRHHMRASVDLEKCIGCELCASICPDVYRMGDDGLAHAIAEPIPSDVENTAKEGAESCPVEAITISE